MSTKIDSKMGDCLKSNIGVENYYNQQAEKLAYFEDMHEKHYTNIEYYRNNTNLDLETRIKLSQESEEKAAYYKKKADNIKSESHGISSDDCLAIEKLKIKLQETLENIAYWKAVPKKERTFDFSETDKRHYMLPNLNAEKRRILKRIDALKQQSEIKQESFENNNIKMEINTDIKRIMLFFPGKPDEEIRTKLKRHGFRWAPSRSAWLAYIKDHNIAFAKNEILEIKEAV